MTPYELTNNQRKYFGLSLVSDDWDVVKLGNSLTLYYKGDKVIKLVHYSRGYFEYDTDIETRGRQILLPKTKNGKEQKLTIARILKIKGSGIQFSGSFLGGGIHVFDNRRNIFFIRSFSEDANIESYEDINKWVTNYISKDPTDYFDWLNNETSQKRLRIGFKEGDVLAFKISQRQYGFARILVDVFAQRQKGEVGILNLYWFHPRSLIVAVYAYYSDDLAVDIDKLVTRKTLPTLCIFDQDVYRGEMPIVGHRQLSLKDKLIPYPEKQETSITIPYSKTAIETFISINGMKDI